MSRGSDAAEKKKASDVTLETLLTDDAPPALMGEEQRRSEQAAFQQAKQRFEDFIDQDWGYGTYKAKIRNMLERGSSRLIVNLNDLRAFDPQLTLRCFFFFFCCSLP